MGLNNVAYNVETKTSQRNRSVHCRMGLKRQNWGIYPALKTSVSYF